LLNPERRACSLTRSGTQFTIEIQQRPRVVTDEPELGYPFPRDFLFLDLLGQEPLKLRHFSEGFVLETQLVERVNLSGDDLLMLQRGLEHLAKRRELSRRLGNLEQLHDTVPRMDEMFDAVFVFLGALGFEPR